VKRGDRGTLTRDVDLDQVKGGAGCGVAGEGGELVEGRCVIFASAVEAPVSLEGGAGVDSAAAGDDHLAIVFEGVGQRDARGEGSDKKRSEEGLACLLILRFDARVEEFAEDSKSRSPAGTTGCSAREDSQRRALSGSSHAHETERSEQLHTSHWPH
jgi:hypothetical protein